MDSPSSVPLNGPVREAEGTPLPPAQGPTGPLRPELSSTSWTTHLPQRPFPKDSSSPRRASDSFRLGTGWGRGQGALPSPQTGWFRAPLTTLLPSLPGLSGPSAFHRGPAPGAPPFTLPGPRWARPSW